MSAGLDKKTLIVGLGKTGFSCACYLASKGVDITVVDSRDNPPMLASLGEHLPAVEVVLGEFGSTLFSDFEQIVVSPGVSIETPAIQAAIDSGAELVGDIELFVRDAKAPIIAVTGSNGKSTVTELLGEMIAADGYKVEVGGNIGVPALDLLSRTVPDFYVLELSSFQLETTHSLNALATVVLNISPDHLDRYQGIAAYRAAKAKVYHGDGIIVVNSDASDMAALIPNDRRMIGFGVGHPPLDQYGLIEQAGNTYLARGEACLMPVSDLMMQGRHNYLNALAALALGETCGLQMEAMLKTLGHFKGLPHRMSCIAERDGVRWINDSKGTNVGATQAAIDGLAGPIVWIAGGVGKAADFSLLRPSLINKVKVAVLMGQDAEKMRAAFVDQIKIVMASDMDEAVDQANRMVDAGDTVLLSPACASFDMFNGFEDRGNAFTSAVQRKLAS